MQALRGVGCEAGVRIAQDEDRVRLQVDHQRVAFRDDVADRRAQIFADYFEEVIRRPEPEVIEEDLVQFVIVILARVHEDLIEVRVALLDYGGQADDLGTGPDDGHQFELCHFTPLRSCSLANRLRGVRLTPLRCPPQPSRKASSAHFNSASQNCQRILRLQSKEQKIYNTSLTISVLKLIRKIHHSNTAYELQSRKLYNYY